MATTDAETRRQHRVRAEAVRYALKPDEQPERPAGRAEAAEAAMSLLINEYPWLNGLVAAAEKATAARRMLDELHAAGATRRILMRAATQAQQADAALSAAWSTVEAEGIEPREVLAAYEKLAEAAGAETK